MVEQFLARVMSRLGIRRLRKVVIEDHPVNEVDEDDDGLLEEDGAAGHTFPSPDAGRT